MRHAHRRTNISVVLVCYSMIVMLTNTTVANSAQEPFGFALRISEDSLNSTLLALIDAEALGVTNPLNENIFNQERLLVTEAKIDLNEGNRFTMDVAFVGSRFDLIFRCAIEGSARISGELSLERADSTTGFQLHFDGVTSDVEVHAICDDLIPRVGILLLEIAYEYFAEKELHSAVEEFFPIDILAIPKQAVVSSNVQLRVTSTEIQIRFAPLELVDVGPMINLLIPEIDGKYTHEQGRSLLPSR